MMKVLGASKHGDALDVLSFTTVPIPTCRPGDLRIRVAYSEVNPVDLHKLAGSRRGKAVAHPPFVPGYGGSGIVVAVGEDINGKDWIDTKVAFLADPSRQGSYAEYICVNYAFVAKLPENISLRDAATVPIAACTAFESLTKLGLGPSHHANPFARILIVGGAGGVGTWATRLLKCWHPVMEIICTASSEASKEWCCANGAKMAIDHREVGSLGGGTEGSVDMILCLAEPTPYLLHDLSDIIRPYGSICLVVGGDAISNVDLGFCFFKGVSIHTETVFGSYRTNCKVFQPSEEMDIILRLLACGRLVAPISPVLADIKEDWLSALSPGGILDSISKGHTKGKLILKIANYL